MVETLGLDDNDYWTGLARYNQRNFQWLDDHKKVSKITMYSNQGWAISGFNLKSVFLGWKIL